MDTPLRTLTPDELRAFADDGVVVARKLLPAHWIDRMARAVDRVVSSPGLYGNVVSIQDAGFSGDLFMWKWDDDFRDWVYESPAARIAEQILGSSSIRHFYDQLFVKPAGCEVPTPWHQDITFWPVELDSQSLCSIWIPFDPVTRATSSLEFVRGSHRWAERFKAVTPDHDPYMRDSDLAEPPDIEARRDEYDLFCPEMEPGDCLIFDAVVLHGSSGNASSEMPRRAFSSRWAGDGVRFEPRHATMPLLWEHGLAPGDELAGPLFPRVLPAPIPEEGARRAEGPEPPDPSVLRKVAETMTKGRTS